MPREQPFRVVLETRDRDGVPYTHVYRHVMASDLASAIDTVLERYIGASAGMRTLIDGWRVVSAWGTHESAVADDVQIVPIDQPLFRRVANDG